MASLVVCIEQQCWYLGGGFLTDIFPYTVFNFLKAVVAVCVLSPIGGSCLQCLYRVRLIGYSFNALWYLCSLWNYLLLPKLELTFFGIFPLWAVSWWCDQVQFFGEEFYELKKFLLCSWRKSSFHWEPSWKNKLMYLGWVLFWPGPWRCILVSCLGICNLIWWNATVAEKEAFLGLVTTVVDYSFTSASYLTRVLWDKRFMMNWFLGYNIQI